MLAQRGNVIAINLFPDSAYGNLGGDYQQLFANALLVIPEPSAWFLMAAGLFSLGLFFRRQPALR